MEHCAAAVARKREELRFRAYVTDALKLVAENTARFAGGSYITARWAEKYLPRDDRSGDEIALEVIRRAGLKANEAR